MTPTALTPAGRGTRSKPRPSQPSRTPASPRTAGAVAEGARTAVKGARQAAHGARATAQGARTAAQGARTAAEGTRAMLDGARTVAEGARMAASASPRTPSRRSTSGPAGGRGAGHRTTVRRSTVPRVPRRVSGPARPTTPGPARPTAPGRAGRSRLRTQPAPRAPLARRCVSSIRALPDHAVLDRIVRGRYWIPLLGVLLVGIVAMQVEVLKLNAGIGRSLERTTSLQARNEQMRYAVARAADDQRIESKAAHMGMVMPPPAAIHFLAEHPVTDVGPAIANIRAPDPTGFEAALTAAAATTAASSATVAAGDTASTAAAATSSSSGATTATGATSSAVIPTAPDPASATSSAN
jgi:hypothetical protein